MIWNSCLNGACTRFEKPTQESRCPVCGERTGIYEPPRQPAAGGPLTAASAARLDDNARRVAERRQQWSEVTGVPLADRPAVPFAFAASSHVQPDGASGWNYLWLLLGLVGGIAGNLMVRDTDPAMAKRLLIGGVIVTVGLPLLLFLLIAA